MQQQITVQYINQRNGNRPPSVKDSAGAYWTIPDDSVGMFQQNQTYSVEFYTNAKGYNVVTAVNGQKVGQNSVGGRAPVGQQGGGWQAPPPPMQPQQQGHNNPPQADREKERGMFVMGVVGRSMGSGKFAPADIPLLVQFANDGWREFLRGAGYTGQQQPAHEPPPPASASDYGQAAEWPNDEPPPFG